MIDYISLAIVLFIASCSLIWMYINRSGLFISGSPIKKGAIVCIEADGKIHEASTNTTIPIGICIDNKDERTFEDVIQIVL